MYVCVSASTSSFSPPSAFASPSMASMAADNRGGPATGSLSALKMPQDRAVNSVEYSSRRRAAAIYACA